MDEGRGRQRAYADLLTGLIDLGPTAATDRFDALLDQGRAAGLVDADTARVLRWWQRESLRAQADHILATAPSMLTALDAAQAQAHEAADLAEEAWERARSDAAAASAAPSAPLRAPDILNPAAGSAVDDGPSGADSETDAAETSTGGRHRAAPDPEAVEDTPLFAEVLADNHVTTLSTANEGDPMPAGADVVDLDAPVRRRRLLVAGLTVIDADRTMRPTADPP